MFGTLKDTISLPNGVTIGRTTVGAVIVEDKDGKRRVLDDMDAAEWLFYSVKGEFPASPHIPTDPASQERARQAQAAIERSPQGSQLHGHTGRRGQRDRHA